MIARNVICRGMTPPGRSWAFARMVAHPVLGGEVVERRQFSLIVVGSGSAYGPQRPAGPAQAPSIAIWVLLASASRWSYSVRAAAIWSWWSSVQATSAWMVWCSVAPIGVSW